RTTTLAEPKPENRTLRSLSQGGPGQSAQPTAAQATFEVPLRIIVELGAAVTVAGTQQGTEAAQREPDYASGADVAERMVEPHHDDERRGRPGYDPDFLGRIRVPLPKPRDPSVVAPLKTGGIVLDYQNFSILMHAERRLALVTASNVTREAHLRR